MKKLDVNLINVIVLAYLGDTIYENYVRRYLIDEGINNVKDLQEESINYVSAMGQAKYVKDLMDSGFFTEEEISVMMRARNNSNNRHPKNCDIMSYKYATGLEAVIGYLDIVGKRERIDEIMNYILRWLFC